MRQTTRRALLLLPGAAVAAACQPKPLTIGVSGDANTVTISASARGPFGVFETPAPIAGVTVWDSEAHDLYWETRSNRCPTTIHEVQYGVSPDGFEQGLTPLLLSKDVVYAVLVESCDGNSGGGYFQIADGRVSQVLYLVAVPR